MRYSRYFDDAGKINFSFGWTLKDIKQNTIVFCVLFSLLFFELYRYYVID